MKWINICFEKNTKDISVSLEDKLGDKKNESGHVTFALFKYKHAITFVSEFSTKLKI